jgi:hypothetical protein
LDDGRGESGVRVRTCVSMRFFRLAWRGWFYRARETAACRAALCVCLLLAPAASSVGQSVPSGLKSLPVEQAARPARTSQAVSAHEDAPLAAEARRFLARRGWARRGWARGGLARGGLAQRGLARQGLAQRGWAQTGLTAASARRLLAAPQPRGGAQISLRPGPQAGADSTWQSVGPQAMNSTSYGLITGRVSSLGHDGQSSLPRYDRRRGVGGAERCRFQWRAGGL